MKRRTIAWILVLVVDAGMLLWGAAAAIAPEQLLGPGGKAILPAGFEGYTGASWSALMETSPMHAAYMSLLFRLYSVFCVLFGFLTSVITVTAFRRGERWAWWTLLVSNIASKSAFNEAFKKHTTQTPSAFRQAVMALETDAHKHVSSSRRGVNDSAAFDSSPGSK